MSMICLPVLITVIIYFNMGIIMMSGFVFETSVLVKFILYTSSAGDL